MNNQYDDFERKARARLQSELSRVAVPQGRPRRVRPQQAAGWGRRLVGATALVAVLALLAVIVVGRINVPAQTAQPDQPAQSGERLYLLSTVGAVVDGAMTASGGRIRAFDPVTQQAVWTLERPVDTAFPNEAGIYWIDGAVAPDGKILYIVERFRILALDAATGQELWSQPANNISPNGTAEWPALTVSADSKTLYVQKMAGAARWIELFDAKTAEGRGRIDLPANVGPGQLIAAPDATTLYYITHEQVLKIRNNQVEPKIYTIATGIRDAALTPDGKKIYLLNGASELLTYDTATLNLNLSSTRLGIQDLRSGLSGTMLLSPSGDRAVVQVFDESYTDPKLYVVDPTTGQRLATLRDPAITEGRWLQGPTLAFDRSGAALYGVANFGTPNPTDWDDRLLQVSLADGSATSLLDLPTEHVARLLVSQAPAPPEAATPPEAPQATAEIVPTAAPTLTPEPKTGLVAWILNANHLRTWERSGRPIEFEFAQDQTYTVTGVIEREPAAPLLVVALADGRAGILEPLSDKLTTLDVPIAAVELPMILSSTGATVAFKTHTDGSDNDQIRLADLDSGASWTLLEQSAVTIPEFLLSEVRLLSWDDEIIFETYRSATHTLWRSAFRPSDPAAPQPQPEALVSLGNGGAIQPNSSAGVVAYTESGGDGLHLLNLQTGQDVLIAPNVQTFALDTVGPFARLAYLREAPAAASGYELVLYSPNSGVETVLEAGTNAITAQLRFVREGGYLVMWVTDPTAYALVFTAGANPRLVAKTDLGHVVSAIDVTSAGEIVTLGTADGQQRLPFYPLDDRASSTVIPIGTLLDEAEPATLVYVP